MWTLESQELQSRTMRHRYRVSLSPRGRPCLGHSLQGMVSPFDLKALSGRVGGKICVSCFFVM